MHSDVSFFTGNVCPPLTAPANADIRCSDTWLYRSTCITECKAGFRLVGSGARSVTCRDDKTWSGVLSGCEGRLWARYDVCTYIRLHIYERIYVPMHWYASEVVYKCTRTFVSMCTNSVYIYMTVI